MKSGKHDGHQQSESHRQLLADAMPLKHVVSDNTKTGEFSYAVSGGFRRRAALKPRVEIIDKATRDHWHERAPEDRDPALCLGWDEDEGKPFWYCWPPEIWPEEAESYLGRNPLSPWAFLGWMAEQAALEGGDLEKALAEGQYAVVRDAHYWMGEFLAQQSPEAAAYWLLLWVIGAPLERREFRSEEGELEGEGMLIDTACSPKLQGLLRHRCVLCVLALHRGHHLSQTLADAFPDVRSGHVLFAWVALLPEGESDERIDVWLTSLEHACPLYMKVRSEEITPEQLARELHVLAQQALRDWSLREIVPVLRERGQWEQLEDLEQTALAAGWRAITRYDIFTYRSSLTEFVRRDAERAASRAREAERDWEEHRDQQRWGDDVSDPLESVGREDSDLSLAVDEAALEQLSNALEEGSAERGILEDCQEEARRDPGASGTEICRRLSRRYGEPRETVRKRLQRAVVKARQET